MGSRPQIAHKHGQSEQEPSTTLVTSGHYIAFIQY